ncbi:MAG: hypothetical protein MO847_11015, partial [Candidatus Protistobacter heckmanni]|nr:hypothetical protein [Candidatus Protistobacter heckmanni]
VNQFRLLGQKRFAPFFWTQFCGALNDNVFKVGFTTLATFHAQAYAGGVAGAAFLISALFILPFLLFSATSGQLADKFEKSALMRLVKNLEIAIMLVAVAGPAAEPLGALCLRLPDGPAFDALRPGEVRLSAAASGHA